MAEWLLHHFFNDSDWVCGSFVQAQADDRIHTRGVTVVADVMSIYAPGLAVFLFVTYGAFHKLISFQVFQWRFADQTFFFHAVVSS